MICNLIEQYNKMNSILLAISASANAYEHESKGVPYRRFVGDYDSQAIVHVTDGTVVVAFRGSESIMDWFAVSLRWQTPFLPLSNRTSAKVHTGFMLQYSTLSGDLMRYLMTIDCASKRIVVTGHSLGGALATMFATELSQHLPHTPVVCHAFACPRVGNLAFVEAIAQMKNLQITRINIENDIIPCLPYFGYTHTPTLTTIRTPAHMTVPWCYLRTRHSVELLSYLLVHNQVLVATGKL
jgi:triacylglycerol lipase